jgi:hypothetical protein
MRHLNKTLAVLTLAAAGLGLNQAAQAGDRVTVIYSNSARHAVPQLYCKHGPATRYYSHGQRYAYAYPYRYEWQEKYRDRHDHRPAHDSRSHHDYKDNHRADARRHDDHRDSRANRPAYAYGDRY